MNISYRWLRALAPEMTDSPERIVERLAMYGAPVDESVVIGEELDDIVIARVESVRKHPNADRLSLCEVDAGTGEPLQVVCGAPNVRRGGHYPFAPVGARLPGGIAIRKARIRGEESRGMLCSERELGLGRDQAGILELSDSHEPGRSFKDALALDDVRLVVDVTPNRPDLLSHVGFARELAPGGVAGVRLPAFPAEAAEDDGGGLAPPAAGPVFPAGGRREGEAGGVRVRLDDAHGCPRYLGAVVRGVHVGPSPEWLASRLRAIGLRPINNLVDATNYVLYELGQPLHAFDLDRLAGSEVRIRRARAGEPITTLDGVRRVLDEEMVVIADSDQPVAVAGVMGSEKAEVTPETRNVFLECALFDARAVRRARTALRLPTDASHRFERGVDPEGLERAARRALSLIVAVAGGTVEPTGVDLYPEPRVAPVVPVRPARVARLLGTRCDADRIAGELECIGFQVVERTASELSVRVPGYRWYDVEREVDLIEEVARRLGYDSFPDELRAFHPSAVPDDALARLENRVRTLMIGHGLLEARTTPFAPAAEGDVALLLPLSADESRLRRALGPGLVHRVEYNFARGLRDVRLFEIGTAFAPDATNGDAPRETTRVAAVLTGARTPPHWGGDVPATDVWDLKSLLVELGRVLGFGDAAVEPGESHTYLVPERSFRLVADDGHVVGGGGQLLARALDAPVWAGPVWVLEVDLTASMAAPEPPIFQPLPAYPATERDVALLVPSDLSAAGVDAAIREVGGELLEASVPFDVYRGGGVPAGMRSIAYRLRFRAPDRTLTDEEADAATMRVLRVLKEQLGVERRGE